MQVLNNMKRCGNKKVEVKFGITGKCIRPNYQIETNNKEVFKFNGNNHEENSKGKHAFYDPRRLTRGFTLQEIEDFLRPHVIK